MSTLVNFCLCAAIIGMLIKIDLNLKASVKQTNSFIYANHPLTSNANTKDTVSPLTGTKPDRSNEYPLTKPVLVNGTSDESVPLRESDSLAYVKAQRGTEQATQKEGGK